MNKLTKSLLVGLLEQENYITGFYGGGFKPPTKGHFAVVKKSLEQFPDIDKFYIVVGSGIRDGVSQDESHSVWSIYKKYLGDKVEIIKADSSPLKYVKDYIKKNTDHKSLIFIGSRDGNDEDEQDFVKRKDFFDKYGSHVEVKKIKTSGGTSGTKAREAAKISKEQFFQYLPKELTDEERNLIFEYVQTVIQENAIKKVADKAKELGKNFAKAFTNQKDDFEGFRPLVVKYLQKQDLTSEEKEKLKQNFTDILKTSGVAITFPILGASGSVLLGWLTNKLTKGKFTTLPSKFKDKLLETQIIEILSGIESKQFLNENASYSQNIDVMEKIAQLTNHMIDKGMNIEPLPSMEFIDGDSENAKDFFGKTAYYDPNRQHIVLYTEGRHPKDIVRSYAHEMIHHIQNLEGRLEGITTTNTQEDDHLNDIESEANLRGTMTFRNWADGLNENILPQEKFTQETNQDYIEQSLKILPNKDKYNLKDYTVEILPIDKVKPTQFGEDYINTSSEYEAEQYQKYIDGEIEVEDLRREDFYPIVVDKDTMEILDGNHRHAVHTILGIPKIKAILISKNLNEGISPFSKKNEEYILSDIKEYGDILEFKIDLENTYQYSFNSNVGEFHDDINNVEIIVKLKPTTKDIPEFKFYSLQDGKHLSFSKLKHYNPKVMNTIFKIFMDEVLPNSPKVLIQPFDYLRYRLFRAMLNTNLDGNQYKIDTKDDPMGQSILLVQKLNEDGQKIAKKNMDDYKKSNNPSGKVKDPFGLNRYARELAQGLEEAIVGDKIECDNCGWSWDIEDGGDDLYTCHKCWHDNTPKQLNEGRYDTLANKLSSIAFKVFKDTHDRGDKVGTFEFRVDHPEEEHDIPSKDFFFDFEGKVEITDSEYKVDGGANAGYDDEGEEITPLLSVKFKIPQNPTKNPSWEDISFDIKDVVRHELEHLTQDGENLKSGKYMKDDQLIRDLIDADLLSKSQYFKLEKEVDAMLQGLYFKAKKSKQPFKDIINNYLNLFTSQEKITPEEKEEILDLWRSRGKALSLPIFENEEKGMKYKIFLDMDGVLVDFDQQFKDITGMYPKEFELNHTIGEFWKAIDKSGVGFWRGMKWMPGGESLYKRASQHDHALLSSPSRSETSKIGKRLWRRDKTPNTKLILSLSHLKKNYAAPNHILIDDRESNIKSWVDAGGIGILYKSADQVNKELDKLGL
jgi:hypothetical protein